MRITTQDERAMVIITLSFVTGVSAGLGLWNIGLGIAVFTGLLALSAIAAMHGST